MLAQAVLVDFLFGKGCDLRTYDILQQTSAQRVPNLLFACIYPSLIF